MSAPVIVGFDGTPGSKAALEEACRLAPQLGAEVVLAFSRRVGAVGGEVADLGSALAERGREILEEGIATAGDTAVRAELVDGRPADALTTLAESLGAQMVIVGSYGEPPLRGALLGSTPHRLLQQCPVPVLVVRADRP